MENYNLNLTDEEMNFLYAQLYVREINITDSMKQHAKDNEVDEVKYCAEVIKRLRGMMIRIDDCKMENSIGDINID